MAKRGSHRGGSRRAPTRSATRRPAGERSHGPDVSAAQQPLIRAFREALRAKEAWEFPATVSGFLAVLDGDPAQLGEFVESLIGTPLAETTAALHVFGAMTDDDLLRRRIRRELEHRPHPVPELLERFGEVRATRAVLMTNAMGDGDNVMLDLVAPGASPATFVVYVDHRIGTVVKDAFLVFEDLADVTGHMRELTVRERMPHAFDDVSLADARAHLEEAIEAYLDEDEADRPEASDSWPMSRPLLQHVLRSMPRGGQGYGDDDDAFADLEDPVTELAHDFLASRQAADLDDDVDHEIAHALAEFDGAFLGDESEWTPATVEVALTQALPAMLSGDREEYERVPDVLPVFIAWVHEERGVPAASTREAVAAIAGHLPAFRVLRDDPDVLLRRRAYELAMSDLANRSERTWNEDRLLRKLGSPEAIATLDATPLPDEPVDVRGVAEDIRERVVAMSDLIDRACAEYFDVEIRTAARRLLALAASASPGIVRRGTRDDNLAAAVLYMAAKANDEWGFWQGGEAARDVMEFIGVTSHPAQRAESVQKAIGVDPYRQYGSMDLGRPELLTSRTRAGLIRLREL